MVYSIEILISTSQNSMVILGDSQVRNKIVFFSINCKAIYREHNDNWSINTAVIPNSKLLVWKSEETGSAVPLASTFHYSLL